MFTSHTRHMEYLIHLMVFVVLFFLHTTLTFAADEKFVPMAHLPGIAGDAVPLPVYINRIYMLTITIGALIGVVKLSMAGVKYALSDVVTDKSSAKKDIMGVFLGLAILLVPFIVLKQINPELVNLELLRNAGKVDTSNIHPQSITQTTENQTTGTVQGQSKTFGALCPTSDGVPNCAGVCEDSVRTTEKISPDVVVTVKKELVNRNRIACEVAW